MKMGGLRFARGGWDTMLTRGFMNAAQPYGVFAHLGSTYVRVKDGVYLVSRGTLEIKDGVVLNPQQETTAVLDAKKSRAIKVNLRGFEQYCKTMITLHEGQIDSGIDNIYYDLARNTRDNQALKEDLACLGEKPLELQFYNELFAKLVYEVGSGGTLTYMQRLREVVYALSGAVKEVEVPIGALKPRQRWATHVYTGFL